MTGPLRAGPLAEHLRRGAHSDSRCDGFVVGRPMLSDDGPPFPGGLPVNACGRVEVLPGLGGHHQRPFLSDQVQQGADQGFGAAHYIAQLA
ncbi:hypothetical protein D3C75_1116160 [compost metagenome]